MVNHFVLAAKFLLPSLSIVLVGVTAMSPVVYAQSEIALPGQFTPFNNPTYCFVDSSRFKQPHIAFLKEKKSGAFTIYAEIREGRVSDLPSAEVLFALINNYRLAIGLPPFEKDPRVCEIAQMRAPEL